MRIGIFGGTFDPPHLGHMILAAEAHYQLRLDRLLWVLTPCPPHKVGQPMTPQKDRIAMLEVVVAEEPAYELSRVDIDRPEPHYALDTMKILRPVFPGAELIYLIGGDSLHDLPTWHRGLDLVKACDAIGVMRRPGVQVDLVDLDEALPGLAAKVRFVETPLLEISSRELRRRIRQGMPFRYYLPPNVFKIIKQRGLYRERSQRALDS